MTFQVVSIAKTEHVPRYKPGKQFQNGQDGQEYEIVAIFGLKNLETFRGRRTGVGNLDPPAPAPLQGATGVF